MKTLPFRDPGVSVRQESMMIMMVHCLRGIGDGFVNQGDLLERMECSGSYLDRIDRLVKENEYRKKRKTGLDSEGQRMDYGKWREGMGEKSYKR